MLAVSPERAALADSAQRLVREHYDPTVIAAAKRSDQGVNRERWMAFAELGWLGTAVSEDSGGLGLPLSLLNVLVEALGPAAMPEPLPGQVAIAGLLLDRARSSPQRDACLQRWLCGEILVSLAHHEHRGQHCYQTPVTTSAEERAGSFRITGCKAAVLDGGVADCFLVSASCENGASTMLAVVPADAAGLGITRYPTFDGRTIADLDLQQVEVPRAARLDYTVVVNEVIDEALLFFAAQLAADSLGIVKALVRITHDHLIQREQFGVKLADLQVLQHRLVDMQMAITRLDSQLELARSKIDECGVAGATEFIAAAKIQAASVGRYVGQQAVQLHGAIGMTDELVVGHYFKRLTANELLGGSADEHLQRFAQARGLAP